jgi:site-specific DNA-methyltransferase (adenine-specific)
MKCTEDIVVFSPGGAAAASKKKGNMSYFPQGLVEKRVEKKNSEKRIGKMLNQKHHLGENNKLISNKPYSQEFTNYPNEILEFAVEKDTVHETQKPVDLLQYLVRTYTQENAIVLDSTMGSGSTGVACVLLNRRFVGIEKTDLYYDIANKRIGKAIEEVAETVGTDKINAGKEIIQPEVVEQIVGSDGE